MPPGEKNLTNKKIGYRLHPIAQRLKIPNNQKFIIMANLQKVDELTSEMFPGFSEARRNLRAEWSKTTGIAWEDYLLRAFYNANPAYQSFARKFESKGLDISNVPVTDDLEAYFEALNSRLAGIPPEKKDRIPGFTNTENTSVHKTNYGWMAETKVNVSGKSWVITTTKRRNGKISTHCHTVQDNGNGCYTYSPFGRDANESFWLNETAGKATENKIREIHFKSLADFDVKAEGGELPEAKKEYEIKVGQIIFTDMIHSDNRQERVIYEIESGRFGTTYKTVLLDGSKTKLDDHVTPWEKKFGIGVYYKENEALDQDQINELLISAHENMKLEAAAMQVQDQINREQREAKEKYLSQFKQADRRATTNIIKRHILKTWPDVRKVDIKTDVYTGGSSMDVRYYSSERIEALESFVDTFQYGKFNSMEDIYECSDNDAPIIEGHILQTYKYCRSYFNEIN